MGRVTANLPTNIVDFRGFDSSIILSLRGGIPNLIGDFPDCLSQAMLVGIMLVARLGVHMRNACHRTDQRAQGPLLVAP